MESTCIVPRSSELTVLYSRAISRRMSAKELRSCKKKSPSGRNRQINREDFYFSTDIVPRPPQIILQKKWSIVVKVLSPICLSLFPLSNICIQLESYIPNWDRLYTVGPVTSFPSLLKVRSISAWSARMRSSELSRRCRQAVEDMPASPSASIAMFTDAAVWGCRSKQYRSEGRHTEMYS